MNVSSESNNYFTDENQHNPLTEIDVWALYLSDSNP